jgi:hypothetical protein
MRYRTCSIRGSWDYCPSVSVGVLPTLAEGLLAQGRYDSDLK